MFARPLLALLCTLILAGCQTLGLGPSESGGADSSAPDKTASPSVETPADDSDTWDDARARGVAFRGIGHNPDFVVEIEKAKNPGITVTVGGASDIHAPHSSLQQNREQGTLTFSGKTRLFKPVDVMVTRGQCADMALQQDLTDAVKINAAGKTYTGCGKFLF